MNHQTLLLFLGHFMKDNKLFLSWAMALFILFACFMLVKKINDEHK